MSENRKDLPAPSAPNFNQRLRETIQTYLGKQGDPLDRGLTLRDLIANGIVKFKDGFNASSFANGGGGGALPIAPVVVDNKPDLTPPPQPTGFAVSAAISHVFIEHDDPIYPQGHGHLRTHVYGAIVEAGDPLPTFDKAVEVGQFPGQVWAMPSNPATTWRLWTKWETVDGVLSATPAGGTNGLEAVTGQDVSAMVQAMTGGGKPFTVLNTPQVIGGVTFPAGIYSTNAFIQDAQVTRAKIANLAVDNAKIANLSADKLTAGSIAVGQHIQSTGYAAGSAGWSINGNGAAEFSGVTVRGAVIAQSGSIGGITIASNAVRAGQTAFNTGTGFFMGSDGKLSLGNPSGNRMTWDGTNLNIVSPGLTVNNGSATFSGNLDVKSATSGARLEIKNNVLKVFDANGVLRVKIGDLSA